MDMVNKRPADIFYRSDPREPSEQRPTLQKCQPVAFTTIERQTSLKIINKNVLIGVAPVNIAF